MSTSRLVDALKSEENFNIINGNYAYSCVCAEIGLASIICHSQFPSGDERQPPLRSDVVIVLIFALLQLVV